MILFSVGTERFPFDRLVQAAEKVAAQMRKESVFVQLGHNAYIPQGCACSRFLSYEELLNKIGDARIVVTHAGAGSILSCLRLGKVPIVVARQRDFGEHVDDHQSQLASRMAELGHVLYAKKPEDLSMLILDYERQVKAMRPFSSAVSPLAKTLFKYLIGSEDVTAKTCAFSEEGVR